MNRCDIIALISGRIQLTNAIEFYLVIQDFIQIDIFRNNAQILAYFHKHPYL